MRLYIAVLAFVMKVAHGNINDQQCDLDLKLFRNDLRRQESWAVESRRES